METMESLFGGSLMSPVPDPYPVYRRLRAERPVVEVDGTLGPVHMVTRYDDVSAALRNPDLYSSRGNARGAGIVMGRTILEMDGKEHQRQRKIVTPAFAPRAVERKIGEFVESTAQEMIGDLRRSGGPADLVSQFTFTFPMRIIASLIGVPIEDFAEFHRWAISLLNVADDPDAGIGAAGKIVEYLRPVLEERRRKPREDLLSILVQAEVEGERLTEDEVLSFLRLLLPAGAETTYRLIGSTLFALLHHPDVLDDLRDSPERIGAVIDETLRWESPVQCVSREAAAPIDVAGTQIPEGSLIMLCLGSANHDEGHFADAASFQPDRANIGDHVGFGYGEHYCPGTHLARLETTVAVRAILDGLPNLRFDPSQSGEMVGLVFRSPDRIPVLFD